MTANSHRAPSPELAPSDAAAGAADAKTAPWTPQGFAEAIAAFFRPQGQLARTKPGYEPRATQLALAEALGAALLGQRPLLAEAGTGTGKTLAYLVPALLSRLKVVISTATKQLQEQILSSDVPAIARALGRPVDVVVLKGRQNYLCALHYARATQELAQLPDQAPVLAALQRWQADTQTGERSEFAELADDAQLWRRLTASREQCLGRSCSFYERCYVVRARRRAQEADLVVVNHHLFFADVAMGQRAGKVRPAGLLPPFEAAIFDEAHELDEIAGQHFGCMVTDHQLTELLGEVARRQTQAATLPDLAPVLTRAKLAIDALFATLPTGGRHLLHVGTPEALGDRSRAQVQLDDALAYLEAELSAHSDEESRQLGERVGDAARRLALVFDLPVRAGLLREAEGWSELADAKPSATPTGEGEGEANDPAPSSAEAPTGPMHGDPRAGAGRGEGKTTDGGEASGRQVVYDDAPPTARAPAVPSFVRFGEVTAHGRAMAARPVDVASPLGALFSELPCLFLSATLQVGGSFHHTRQRLGLTADVEGLAQQSPFDFARQATLYLAQDLPEPERDARGAHAAARAAQLVEASAGGALVLCTSHRAITAMQSALRGRAPGPLLVQGKAPKAHLLASFAARTDATLVATLGFWRGVDVPGHALRLVVMDRIPFAVPSDPLVQAKMAALIAQGQDPFAGYQLPQAALLLRQGFGRLIRRQQDRGVVALLDRRIVSRAYGAQLLASLPACPQVTQLEEIVCILNAQRVAPEALGSPA